MNLWLSLFTGFFVLIAAVSLAVLRAVEASREARLKAMMDSIDPQEPKITTSVMIQPVPARNRGLEQLLEKTPGLDWVPAAVRRMGPKWNVTGVLASSLALGLAGFYAGSKFGRLFGPVGPVLGAVLLGAVPFLYLLHRTAKTMRAFQEQLPDAIDFLARSVRTGNAFSITLELLIPETIEPLRSEFLKVSRELALGSALDVALKNLVARVPLLELRFFVAAVLLQRETGGNLAETLTKLSFSIRERLRLKGHIQAASSQGRLTARVLSILPVALVLVMDMISPAYFKGMTTEPIGRLMLIAAVVAQVIGYLCMKKIVSIEV
jgi:tight adherence protein B